MHRSRSAEYRIADVDPLLEGDILVLTEYPYYRADYQVWEENLRALKGLGATVVTAYIPWRLHEVDPAATDTSRYDFTGRTHPQRNVLGFLKLLAELGLRAILKPGPFIHAEVRLGGLPERVRNFPPRVDWRGQIITDEGAHSPSAHSGEFAIAASHWLHAVRSQVVNALAYPSGPVIGLQIGNEGVFSDLHQPIDRDDFSRPALAAGRSWFGSEVVIPTDASSRQAWLQWSGVGTRIVLSAFQESLGDRLPTVVNLPLPGHPGDNRLPETWLIRSAAAAPDKVLIGATSWSGNAMISDRALVALWLGMRFFQADMVEENWGFTWTDDSYAAPAAPLYNSLLSLAFGSSTVSVYTSCTTYHWLPELSPDPAGVLSEGGRPEDFTPPYCPGAPLDEHGDSHPNAAALLQLTTFFSWFGRVLRSATACADALLLVDPVSVAESAWPRGSDIAATCHAPLSLAAAAAVRWLVHDGVEVDVVRPNSDDLVIGEELRTWLVVGGATMGRRSQHLLADAVLAGNRCVVVGPMPEYDEFGHPCVVLDKAMADSVEARHLPGTRADFETEAAAVHATLSADGGDGDDQILTLTRQVPGTDTRVLYLFSRFESSRVYRGEVAGAQVAAAVAPRGVVVLILEGRSLQGLLFNRGVSKTTDTFEPFITVSGEDIPLGSSRDTVARRTTDGWQFWDPSTAEPRSTLGGHG
ncbi:MAG: beta-galactosidase [Nocardioides sp.]